VQAKLKPMKNWIALAVERTEKEALPSGVSAVDIVDAVDMIVK